MIYKWCHARLSPECQYTRHWKPSPNWYSFIIEGFWWWRWGVSSSVKICHSSTKTSLVAIILLFDIIYRQLWIVTIWTSIYNSCIHLMDNFKRQPLYNILKIAQLRTLNKKKYCSLKVRRELREFFFFPQVFIMSNNFLSSLLVAWQPSWPRTTIKHDLIF